MCKNKSNLCGLLILQIYLIFNMYEIMEIKFIRVLLSNARCHMI